MAVPGTLWQIRDITLYVTVMISINYDISYQRICTVAARCFMMLPLVVGITVPSPELRNYQDYFTKKDSR